MQPRGSWRSINSTFIVPVPVCSHSASRILEQEICIRKSSSEHWRMLSPVNAFRSAICDQLINMGGMLLLGL